MESTGTCILGPTCPAGSFLNATLQTCRTCKAECTTCTSASVCTNCQIGFSLTGSNCVQNCGNSVRQPGEECDDGNAISGDGCSSNCKIENGYLCSLSSPDLCRCDPVLSNSEWIDHWGAIRLTFEKQLYYNTNLGAKSSNPFSFCSQIIDPATLALLG